MADQLVRLHADGFCVEVIPNIGKQDAHVIVHDLNTGEKLSFRIKQSELVEFSHLLIRLIGN